MWGGHCWWAARGREWVVLENNACWKMTWGGVPCACMMGAVLWGRLVNGLIKPVLGTERFCERWWGFWGLRGGGGRGVRD